MEEKKSSETTKKKRKGPRIVGRIILFILALVLIFLAVIAVVFRDQLNMDSMRRWFKYRSLVLSDSGQAEQFDYDGSLNDTFASLDGDLLVCSRNAISLYSGSGTRYVSQSVGMTNPVVRVNGSLAVVYDAGGSSIYVLGQRQLIWQSSDMGSILSAHLNKNGQLTVVTQTSGYRGTVTVYDSKYTPLVSVNLSSSFVMDAALSDDGKTLSILTIGQEKGTFTSSLALYALNTTQTGEFTPDEVFDLGSDVIIDILHTSDHIWSVGEQGLYITNRKGKTTTSDWSDRYLKRYTLGGDDFAAALLGRYRAGSQAELCVVGSDGVRLAIDFNEQVLALSAAGRYLAVLTGDRLDIYTDTLELYQSLEGTQGARNVLMLPDGSAILISAGTASYYIP